MSALEEIKYRGHTIMIWDDPIGAYACECLAWGWHFIGFTEGYPKKRQAVKKAKELIRDHFELIRIEEALDV